MRKLKGNVLLLITAMIWGSSFVAQSIAGDSLGAFTFNASRSFVAALFLFPFSFLFDKLNKKAENKPFQNKKKLILAGIICGAALCIASAFQQIGISHTTVGKAGFITAMYIIIVPLLSRLLGKPIHPIIWVGVLLSVAGLYLLCISDSFSVSIGDIFMILCAFCFAVHILMVDHFSNEVDGIKMSCIQFFVAGILSLIIALVFENPAFIDVFKCILPILYTGVFSSGVAYTLQIIAQKDVNPTAASLIMSMESVFAALSGWLILRESFSFKEFIGCVLVFSAVIIAQIPDMRASSIKNPAD